MEKYILLSNYKLILIKRDKMEEKNQNFSKSYLLIRIFIIY